MLAISYFSCCFFQMIHRETTATSRQFCHCSRLFSIFYLAIGDSVFPKRITWKTTHNSILQKNNTRNDSQNETDIKAEIVKLFSPWKIQFEVTSPNPMRNQLKKIWQMIFIVNLFYLKIYMDIVTGFSRVAFPSTEPRYMNLENDFVLLLQIFFGSKILLLDHTQDIYC